MSSPTTVYADAPTDQNDGEKHKADTAPNLERLVQHFVAAKQSLSATAAVYRANEIVSLAREYVERRSVLDANNAFVRRGLDQQLQTMRRVHGDMETVGSIAQEEFEGVVRSLDIANDRLQSTLATLRRNPVKPAVQKGRQSQKGSEKDSEKPVEGGATLYDFIDEATHASQLDDLRKLIDTYNTAQATLHQSRSSLDSHVRELQEKLSSTDESTTPKKAVAMKAKSAQDQDTIGSSFYFLVDQATEMASLLQSLIAHYDLCVSALKHVEGGSEAARLATNDDIVKHANTIGIDLEPLTNDDPKLSQSQIQEMTNSELRDMLTVLETDAAQVEDVVQELSDRQAEMESGLVALEELSSPAAQSHHELRQILLKLKDSCTTLLPDSLTASTTFRAEWAELREGIKTRTSDLTSLTTFYESFIKSHAALLHEIDRRSLIADKMRSVAERARRDLDALFAEDEDMRSSFLKDVAEFLPSDIWPGLTEGPDRWVVGLRRDAGVEVLGQQDENTPGLELGDERVVAGSPEPSQYDERHDGDDY